MRSWVETGIPVILDVAPGYDAHIVFAPQRPEDPIALTWGNNNQRRNAQTKMIAIGVRSHLIRRIGLRTSIRPGPAILRSVFIFVLAPLFLLHSKQELFHSLNRCVFSLEERDDREQNAQQLLDQ